MDTKLNILFYIGIIVPTTITVGFFVGFLICWFQCNLKDRLLEFRDRKKTKSSSNHLEREGDTAETGDKASQHSADSAIDVNELELTTLDDKPTTVVNGSGAISRSGTLPNSHLSSWAGNTGIQNTAHFLTEADIHSNLSKGMYPSHEKLNDEIHSEPRIYETPEDLEIAVYNGLAPPMTSQHSYHRPVKHDRHLYDSYAPPRLLGNRRTSYSGSAGPMADNHSTDYGFAPWQRPNTVCAVSAKAVRGLHSNLPLPKHTSTTDNSSSLREENTTNFPFEILHV